MRETVEEYNRKLAVAFTELNAAGVPKSHYNPMMDRVLRAWGVQMRPPQYRTGLSLGFGAGAYFAVVWGTAMYFLRWKDSTPIDVAVPISILAGCGFGALMAMFMRHTVRKHNLRKWQDL